MNKLDSILEKIEAYSTLMEDLCVRLPHHVMVTFNGDGGIPRELTSYERWNGEYHFCAGSFTGLKAEEITPYLRNIDSMTENENQEIMAALTELEKKFGDCDENPILMCKVLIIVMRFMYKHHFDVCGFIEQGLALEAPKDMYKF